MAWGGGHKRTVLSKRQKARTFPLDQDSRSSEARLNLGRSLGEWAGFSSRKYCLRIGRCSTRASYVGSWLYDSAISRRCDACAVQTAQPMPEHRHDEHRHAHVEGLPQVGREGEHDEAEDLRPDAEERHVRKERRLVAQGMLQSLGNETAAEAVLTPADRDPRDRPRAARYSEKVRIDRRIGASMPKPT